MNINPVYSSREVLDFTYQCCDRVANIEGDLIECGVGAGSQLAMMEKWCIDKNSDKIVFGYDSYEGIPFAGDMDDSQPGIGEKDESKKDLLITTGISSHSINNVISNFEGWGVPYQDVVFEKGWFQNTIPNNKHKKISLLRLDGDLYESTKVCMEHLYDKVSVGGIIILDDWLLPGSRKAFVEFIDEKKVVEHLGIAYIVKE
jgi:O-methyltransferase